MRKYQILLMLVFASLCWFGCEKTPEKRKIRLAGNEDPIIFAKPQSTTTIQLEPKERRSVAVLFFKNKTGDESLGWLQKGLTEMFIRALSQSNSISILSTDRLFEIMNRLKKEKAPNYNLNMAALIAREANVEVLLTGSITKSGDSLMLNVTLHEPQQGMVIKEEAIEGRGLENLFEMVDNLTTRIKDDLLLTLDQEPPAKGIAELSSNSLEAWQCYTAGIEARNKFLNADAIAELTKAIEYDSTFIAAYLGLALVYTSVAQPENARQEFLKAKSLKDKATPPEMFQIDWFEALFNNDLQKMLETNRAWIAQYPNDRDANQNMANSLYGRENFRAAIEYYRKVLEIDPKYTPALNQLGYAYANLGQFNKAFEIMEHYKKITSDEPNPFDSTGDIYLLAGDFEKAEQNYRKALEIRNDFIASWQNLANIYLFQGQYPQALQATDQYLKFAGENNIKMTGHLFKAAIFWRQEQYSEARQAYEKVLQINPVNPTIIQRISEIYEIEKNPAAAARKNLEKYYQIIFRSFHAETNPYQAILTLFQLSLWHGVHTDDTIRLLENFRVKNKANQILQIQTRFLLSILFIQTNTQSKLTRIWDNVPPAEVMSVLREVGNFSYTNLWKYYEIVNQYYYQHLEQGIQNYDGFISFAVENDMKMVEVAYRMFLVDLLMRAGRIVEAEEHLVIAGMPLENIWMVCGPFENTNGFNRNFPPEKQIDLSRLYLEWHTASDSSQDGFINLREILKASNWAVGYGLVYLDAPEAQLVQFRIGSNEAVKIWLNDKLVWKMNAMRAAGIDSDIFEVNLRKGKNKILVKVANTFGNWGYYFRVTDFAGNGVPGLEFVSPKQAATTAFSD